MKNKIKQLHINEDSEYIYSEYHIGKYHYIGKDIKKEAESLRIQADIGDADALYALGMCYHRGLGVIQNLNEAIRLYELSSNQENTDAQYALATLLHYEEVKFSYDNLTKAHELYNKASNNGHVSATLHLAHIYYTGYKTIKQDIEESLKLWTRLSITGNYIASQNLNMHFRENLH